MYLLDTLALWISGIAFTCMTVIAGITICADERCFVLNSAEKWADRAVFLSLAALALLTLTAAVL